MERIRLRFFNAVAATSLLLCVGTAALHVESYWRSFGIRWVHDFTGTNRFVQIRIDSAIFRGGFNLIFWHHHATTPESVDALLGDHQWHRTTEVWSSSSEAIDAATTGDWRVTYRFMPTSASLLGFQFKRNVGEYKGNQYWTLEFAVPFWFPMMLFAVLPFYWFWRFRNARMNARRGLCACCGYDLRASVDRCPECGTVILAKSES